MDQTIGSSQQCCGAHCRSRLGGPGQPSSGFQQAAGLPEQLKSYHHRDAKLGKRLEGNRRKARYRAIHGAKRVLAGRAPGLGRCSWEPDDCSPVETKSKEMTWTAFTFPQRKFDL